MQAPVTHSVSAVGKTLGKGHSLSNQRRGFGRFGAFKGPQIRSAFAQQGTIGAEEVKHVFIPYLTG
jgi:hypothetical protein